MKFANYIIYEHWGSDRDSGCETPISTYVDNYSTELPVEEVDFEYNKEDIESIHYLDYVMLDNWYEDLRSELISAYQELGYIWLKDYELDPFNSPGNTECLCFVKILVIELFPIIKKLLSLTKRHAFWNNLIIF